MPSPSLDSFQKQCPHLRRGSKWSRLEQCLGRQGQCKASGGAFEGTSDARARLNKRRSDDEVVRNGSNLLAGAPAAPMAFLQAQERSSYRMMYRPRYVLQYDVKPII